MNLHVEPLDTHEVRLTIGIDDDTVNKIRRDTARELAKQVRIPGFRPGNAPMNAVIRAIGGEKVFETEVVDRIAKDVYPKALEASGVEPYGPGSIEEFKQSPYQLITRIPLEPVVDLKDYKSVRLSFPIVTVSDDEIEQQLQLLREDNAIVQIAERPSERGDLVEADIYGHIGDLEVFHTQNRRGIVLDDAHLVVPGLAQLIVGMSAGDHKEDMLHMPDDIENQELRGKDVQVHIDVTRVNSRQLPEINDELAQTASSFGTLTELRDEVRKRVFAHKDGQVASTYAAQTLDAFTDLADVKYPPQFVDQHLSEYLADFKEDVKESTGLPFDEWLKVQGKTEQQVIDELRPTAELRGKRGLVMRELVRADTLDVSDSEIAAEVEATARRYGNRQSEVRKLLAQQETLGTVKNNILSNKVLDRMVKIAKGEAEASTPMRPLETMVAPEAAN